MSDEYARVFCISENPPTLRTILAGLKAEGVNLEIQPYSELDIDSPDWRSVGLIYEAGKTPLSVELIIPPALDYDSELTDFIAIISDTKQKSRGREIVLQHLTATRFYIAVLLSPDSDESTLRVTGQFLSYFARNYGGIVQTDEEGFFEGRKTLLQFQWKS